MFHCKNLNFPLIKGRKGGRKRGLRSNNNKQSFTTFKKKIIIITRKKILLSNYKLNNQWVSHEDTNRAQQTYKRKTAKAYFATTTKII